MIYLQNSEKSSTLHNKAAEKVGIGTYYLADLPKYFEIQRTNNFIFYVVGLAGSLDIPQNKYAQANAEDIIQLSVSKASVPHFKQSPIEVKRGNNTMKFAGTPTFDSGSITVNDFIGAGTKDVLLAWQRKAYDVQTEKVGLASDYKRDAYLIEQTPDYQTVRVWVLKGCWISGLSEGGYDHEGNGKNTIDVTIEYDKAWVDTTGIE